MGFRADMEEGLMNSLLLEIRDLYASIHLAYSTPVLFWDKSRLFSRLLQRSAEGIVRV
jgi:hypothetical protein